MNISITSYSSKRTLHRFSLVELLVVILIIAALLALGVGGFSIAQKKLAETRTRATMEKIKLALEAYKTKHGYYIQEYGAISGDYYFRLDIVDGTNAGRNNISKILSYNDTSHHNQLVIDSYSGAIDDAKKGETRSLIKYKCPATDAPFELRSSGHDRKFSTKDDIVVK